MTTLRVFVDDPPAVERDAAWALFDATGRVVRTGRGAKATWPAADQLEAVIAAAHGRLITLSLPPLPAARVAAAARYALEDQLAGAPEDSHLAAAPQQQNGALRVAIVADAKMRAFAAASQRCEIAWRRAVLESDLASPPPGSWCWCAPSIDQPGFVRTEQGASIAVGPARDSTPPDELLLALSRAGDRPPRTVRVDAAGATGPLLARGREQTGIEFRAGVPWRWSDASPALFAAAIDLLCGPYDTAPRARAVDPARLFRPALIVAAAALAIHVGANVGTWLWLHWQSSQIERELAAVARVAAPDAPADAAPARAIARREGELRHRVGLAANDDYLPLLARAAPALAMLSPATVRGLSYADGHLVLELQKLDPVQLSNAQHELQSLGLVAIAAPTAGGARLRIGSN